MKIAVDMPRADNLDWGATYYAFLSIGMYDIKIWAVDKSVDELKAHLCQSVEHTVSPRRAECLKKEINEVTPYNQVVQSLHSPWRFAIAECDCKLYVLYNSNLCTSERFIFEDGDSPLRIKYAGSDTNGIGKHKHRRNRHTVEHII